VPLSIAAIRARKQDNVGDETCFECSFLSERTTLLLAMKSAGLTTIRSQLRQLRL